LYFAVRIGHFVKHTLRLRHCSLALTRSLLGLATLAATVAASAAPTVSTVELKPAQVSALGIRVSTAVASSNGAARGLPSTVLVPSGQQRVLAAPLPALVERLNASVGDTVRAGQVLAVLRSAQAQELQRDVLSSGGQAALAASTLARDELLFTEGLIAQSRLDASRAQARQAQLQQQDRQRALAQAGAAPGADGSLLLRASIDGVVLERPVVVGQRLDPATVVYRIGKLSPLWLELQMPVDEAGAVRIGDPVQVLRSDTRGKVIGVSPVVDGASQTVLVRAELPQPSPDLRIGQAVEARIERAQPDALQVPAAAVIDQGGKPGVFVESAAGRYRLVTVAVLSSSGGVSAVRGLAVGARVVDQGTAALKALLVPAQP
jgi:cobalt-zinc-cadmium efflux system membrane fusion protein